MDNDNSSNWSFAHTTICALFVFIIPVIAYFFSEKLTDFLREDLLQCWLFVIAGFLSLVLTVGHGVTGSWKGAFIDNRNVISLSRFQILGWTILVLSALSTIALWNIFVTDHACLTNEQTGCLPGLPEELWLLMGISTASMVGSPLILDTKKKRQPDEQEKRLTFQLLAKQGYKGDLLDNRGQLVVNTSPSQARFSGLFTGEETGNFAHLDMARLQMFFFTVVSLVLYGVQVGAKLSMQVENHTFQMIGMFPELSSGLLALIGISHTGYLAAKSVSHSQAGSQTDVGSSGSSTPLSSDVPEDEHPAVG